MREFTQGDTFYLHSDMGRLIPIRVMSDISKTPENCATHRQFSRRTRAELPTLDADDGLGICPGCHKEFCCKLKAECLIDYLRGEVHIATVGANAFDRTEHSYPTIIDALGWTPGRLTHSDAVYPEAVSDDGTVLMRGTADGEWALTFAGVHRLTHEYDRGRR